MKILIYRIHLWDLPEQKKVKLTERAKSLIENSLAVKEAKAEVAVAYTHEDAIREVRDADVVFGYITPEMLRNAKRLKWVQATVASLGLPHGEYYIFPELVKSDVIVTNVSGIYVDDLPNHVWSFILALARCLPARFRNQMKHDYFGREMKCRPTSLNGKTLGIIGLGGIGTEVARRAVPFGMTVIAVDPRRPKVPFVNEVWGPEELERLLRQSDFVVMCLPHAPGTVRLMGREQFKWMKKTAYIINIGRGMTLDTDALVEAIKNGEIAGAGLSVFEPWYEPLPEDHPLWDLGNVIITPHGGVKDVPEEEKTLPEMLKISPREQEQEDRRTIVFLENFERFRKGERLMNIIDKEKMILVP